MDEPEEEDLDMLAIQQEQNGEAPPPATVKEAPPASVKAAVDALAAEVEEEERLRQIGMFQQVLKIDPVDQVANFGLGTIYLEQGDYQAALPPLQTVVEHYPDYSAAWLVLGKTLEKLKQFEQAAEIYRKGIAAASKKGDLMPLRDMQNRLNQLSHSAS